MDDSGWFNRKKLEQDDPYGGAQEDTADSARIESEKVGVLMGFGLSGRDQPKKSVKFGMRYG